MNVPEATSDEASERRDARLGHFLLALLVVAYAVFLLLYVPRMNNYVLSDREFTGWSGPIAERVLRGERPYVDFFLPIPPGSFVILAFVQKLMGRALLLQELALAATLHLGMGLVGYAIARRFSTRKVALMVALSTLVLVTQTPKECAYDHTSLIFAWLSMLTGAVAALADDGARRIRFWALTGFFTAFSLYFKQSTAVGVLAGWLLALAYLAWIELRARRFADLRARFRDAFSFSAGVAAGVALDAALLVAERASIGGFVRTVLVDGPALKGGTRALLFNLFNFTMRHDAIRNALLPTAVVAAIGFAIVKKRGTAHVGDEPESRSRLSAKDAAMFAFVVVATYGSAIFLLAAERRSMAIAFTAIAETLKNIPPYGYVFGVAFFVAHLKETAGEPERRRRVGHALNALLLSSVTCSMIYDTSFIQYSAFYYNDPSIPVVLLCLFIATERSGYRWATPFVLALCALPTFGVKLNRALSADVRVRNGQWAGMRVNYRGVEILKAATRAQELAGPNGTVLVLPEDMEIAGLVQRPRPPVLGAVLFVDQYPMRFLAHDLAAIDAHPPDVIIVHPRRAEDWQGLFHTWTFGSAAEKVMDHVLTKLLPKDYVLDSTYPTIYFFDQGQLDVYARKHEGAE